MAEFRMPSLGADMDAGTLTAWHVAPGARVHRGDIVATVDTSKAEIDVEIFDDGVIDELLVAPGTRVPVGAPLATLTTEAGAATAPEPQPAPGSAASPGPPRRPRALLAPPRGPRRHLRPPDRLRSPRRFCP